MSQLEENSADIDYLETAIKCVELFQWLSRHFNDKNFSYDINALLENKLKETLNKLLSEKLIKRCASCGCEIDDKSKFASVRNVLKTEGFKNIGGLEDAQVRDPYLAVVDLGDAVTQKENPRRRGRW